MKSPHSRKAKPKPTQHAQNKTVGRGQIIAPRKRAPQITIKKSALASRMASVAIVQPMSPLASGTKTRFEVQVQMVRPPKNRPLTKKPEDFGDPCIDFEWLEEQIQNPQYSENRSKIMNRARETLKRLRRSS